MPDLSTIDIALLVAVVIVVVGLGYMIGKSSNDDANHSFTDAPDPAISKAVATAPSRFFGEDNPINAYAKVLRQTNMFDPLASGKMGLDDQMTMLLRAQGTLSKGEQEQHRTYYQSNQHLYPIQIAGDPHEMRTTRSPYKAGTRSMRAVKIPLGESQVPDKLERTVDPNA